MNAGSSHTRVSVFVGAQGPIVQIQGRVLMLSLVASSQQPINMKKRLVVSSLAGLTLVDIDGAKCQAEAITGEPPPTPRSTKGSEKAPLVVKDRAIRVQCPTNRAWGCLAVSFKAPECAYFVQRACVFVLMKRKECHLLKH